MSDNVDTKESKVEDLKKEIEYLKAENASLKIGMPKFLRQKH